MSESTRVPVSAPERFYEVHGKSPESRALLVDLLCDLLERGVPTRLALRRLGVSSELVRTWRGWAKEGKGEFIKIIARLTQAQAKAGVSRIENVVAAADDGDWKAAAWLLSHQFPTHFGRDSVAEQVEVVEPPEPKDDLLAGYHHPDRIRQLAMIAHKELGLTKVIDANGQPIPQPPKEQQEAPRARPDPIRAIARAAKVALSGDREEKELTAVLCDTFDATSEQARSARSARGRGAASPRTKDDAPLARVRALSAFTGWRKIERNAHE